MQNPSDHSAPASTLRPSSSNDGSSSTPSDSPGEKKIGLPIKKNGEFDEKIRPDSDSGTSDSGYEDRGEHEVDDLGKKKRVKVVLEKKTGKELVKEIGSGPYTVPRW